MLHKHMCRWLYNRYNNSASPSFGFDTLRTAASYIFHSTAKNLNIIE